MARITALIHSVGLGCLTAPETSSQFVAVLDREFRLAGIVGAAADPGDDGVVLAGPRSCGRQRR